MSKSIISDDKVCFVCRGSATDIHHCLAGRNRKKADKYGLTVWLCRKCHTRIHSAKEGDPYMNASLFLKQTAQQAFEKQIGTREDFIKEFGRNYL